jgi:hypothetical protein
MEVLTSPLLEFYNAILVIPFWENMVVEDEVGNPVVLNTGNLEYKAYLNPARNPDISYSVGIDSTKTYFEGYLVEHNLPPEFKLPATVKCRKRRGANDIWDEGDFEILARYLPIDIVEEVLGDAIAGYFRKG